MDPHLHTASSEGYVVSASSGSVQTLCPQGFAQTELAPGVVVWFTPGVVHRLVNDGALEILVVMSNTGLAVTGDAVLTFPAGILGDPGATEVAAKLPILGGAASPDAVMTASVRTRLDLAVEGFAQFRTGGAAGTQ